MEMLAYTSPEGIFVRGLGICPASAPSRLEVTGSAPCLCTRHLSFVWSCSPNAQPRTPLPSWIVLWFRLLLGFSRICLRWNDFDFCILFHGMQHLNHPVVLCFPSRGKIPPVIRDPCIDSRRNRITTMSTVERGSFYMSGCRHLPCFPF